MSLEKENLKTYVQKLIELEDEEAKYKTILNEIKDKKEEVSEILMNFMVSNQIQDKDIILAGKKVKYSTSRTQESITKKLILDKLTLFLKDEKQAESATQFIYDQRNTVTKNFLKISSQSGKDK
jgi:hypothetical protein